jgi:hypothetical protein
VLRFKCGVPSVAAATRHRLGLSQIQTPVPSGEYSRDGAEDGTVDVVIEA